MMIDKLLTIDELESNTDELYDNDKVEITHLGKSRSGRDIRMISAGEGDRDALILGVPHPNEPVGAITVERLIHQVLTDTATQNLGYRWHFIKAIDPDGLQLNEGWFSDSLTLRNYMRNYFRPALKNQPEYSFPLDHSGYSFDNPTPENLCWQKALEITQPAFQSSLHHADIGGVFHCVSCNIPDLSMRLSQQAQDSCLGVNQIGDPGMPEAPFAPGVFGFPNPVKVLNASAGKGWPAGDTAASWAERRYNTFSLVTEVPLWHDKRVLDPDPSGVTLGELFDYQLSVFDGVVSALEAAEPLLNRQIDNQDDQQIIAALVELRQFTSGFRDEMSVVMDKTDLAIALPSNVWAARSQLTLAAMRTHAMIIRLCSRLEIGNGTFESVREPSEAALEAMIEKFESDTNLEPVSLALLTNIQMEAVLTTARYLAKD